MAAQKTTDASQTEHTVETDRGSPEQLPSPLLSEGEIHGTLYLSSFDAEHDLYPVKILSVDGWLVPADYTEQKLRLALGTHQIKVTPDFSNIEPQTVFMASPWQEKHISFTILDQQDIAVAARLMDKQELEWDVQMYRVEIPIIINPEQTPLIEQTHINFSGQEQQSESENSDNDRIEQ